MSVPIAPYHKILGDLNFGTHYTVKLLYLSFFFEASPTYFNLCKLFFPQPQNQRKKVLEDVMVYTQIGRAHV